MGATCTDCRIFDRDQFGIEDSLLLQAIDSKYIQRVEIPSILRRSRIGYRSSLHQKMKKSIRMQTNLQGIPLIFLADLLKCKGFQNRYSYTQRFAALTEKTFMIFKNRMSYYFKQVPIQEIPVSDIEKVNFYQKQSHFYIQILHCNPKLTSQKTKTKNNMRTPVCTNIPQRNLVSQRDKTEIPTKKEVFAIQSRKEAQAWKQAFANLTHLQISIMN